MSKFDASVQSRHRSRRTSRLDERADHAAQRLDLAARPAGLGEDGADRVAGRGRAVGRVEIAGGGERFVELADQAFELLLRRARLGRVRPRSARERLVLRPFIGDQDHRLGEVQRAEVRD